MPNVIVEPEEDGTFANRRGKRLNARSETQLGAGDGNHDAKPGDHSVAAGVQPRNANLDQFRHLFGPKRRGR